jgi:nucleoside-diphosphate-sugar epimerase
MKVLVTGATGFIGSALIDYFSKMTNVTVVGMVRSIKDIPIYSTIEYRIGEICSAGEITITLNDIDVIIHTAGRAHVMNDISANPLDEFRRVNTLGTLSLARLAADSGVQQFIFLSSIKVNGERNDLNTPFSKYSIAKPNDPYGHSKYEAEVGLRGLASETSLGVTIIRPTLVYGPGVKGNFNTLVKLLSLRIPLPLKGVNNNRRSMVGIGNLVSLIVTCVRHPGALNEIFLVSDGDDLSTSNLLKLLGNSIGYPVILFNVPQLILAPLAKLLRMEDRLQRIVDTLSVDISHTCEQLDWEPPFSVEHGFKRLRESK